MGTEQQQELKSVKSSTKPKRKVIPFNDHSIEAWRPKKDKDRIGFVISNTTKGIKILYREKTKQKILLVKNIIGDGNFKAKQICLRLERGTNSKHRIKN